MIFRFAFVEDRRTQIIIKKYSIITQINRVHKQKFRLMNIR